MAVKTDRRTLLKTLAVAGAATATGVRPAEARAPKKVPPQAMGMLYDTTRCIGCKACVFACQHANEMEADRDPNGLHLAPVDLNGETKNVIKLYTSYVSQSDLAALIAKHTGGRVLPFRIPARPIQWAGDVVEAGCVQLGIEPPIHRRRVDFWTKSRAFTIEKARRLLGYAPRVDVDEGIARTAAWYREAGWL